ncbi:hypothetical protein BJY01DRAFT_227246 [Aspergillus pseudoustus]|uniref:Uncharacterized protein n=1 Tax=Aspergillus pseudoustus TaxID=1810923 RepID=A0ABR4IRK8_9EURO
MPAVLITRRNDMFIIYNPVPIVILLRTGLLQKILVGAVLGTSVFIHSIHKCHCSLGSQGNGCHICCRQLSRYPIHLHGRVALNWLRKEPKTPTWPRVGLDVLKRYLQTRQPRETWAEAVNAVPAVAVPCHGLDGQADRSSVHQAGGGSNEALYSPVYARYL